MRRIIQLIVIALILFMLAQCKKEAQVTQAQDKYLRVLSVDNDGSAQSSDVIVIGNK